MSIKSNTSQVKSYSVDFVSDYLKNKFYDFSDVVTKLYDMVSGTGYSKFYLRCSPELRLVLDSLTVGDKERILSLDRKMLTNRRLAFFMSDRERSNLVDFCSGLSNVASSILFGDKTSFVSDYRDAGIRFKNARKDGWGPLLDLDGSNVSRKSLEVLMRNYLISPSGEDHELYLGYLPAAFPLSKEEILGIRDEVKDSLFNGVDEAFVPFKNGIFLLTSDLLDSLPDGVPGRIFNKAGKYDWCSGPFYSFGDKEIKIPEEGLVLYRRKGLEPGRLSAVFSRIAFGELFDVGRDGYWKQVRIAPRYSFGSGKITVGIHYFEQSECLRRSKGIRMS